MIQVFIRACFEGSLVPTRVEPCFEGYYTLGGAKENKILQNFGAKQGLQEGAHTPRWQNCASGIVQLVQLITFESG